MLILMVPFVAGSIDLAIVGRSISERFRAEVSVRTPAFDPSDAYDASRGQYSARTLLDMLPEPPGGGAVIGVTTLDIFVPLFTHVFGLGVLRGGRSVVSGYRLDATRYGEADDRTLLSERLLKEAVHELGHAFGLVHCHHPECVMQACFDVGEVDLKRADFCSSCRSAFRRTAT